MQDRDMVYNDLIGKLTMPDNLETQGQVFTDKQAISMTY
jgi:hypothetical protein